MTDQFQSRDDLGSSNRLERLNYVLGQVLGVQEFKQEQAYFLNKAQVQNRALHGSGTVEGLAITCYELEQPSDLGNVGDYIVTVSPGLAIDQQGREIWVTKPQCANLSTWFQANSEQLLSLDPAQPNQKRVNVLLRYRDHLAGNQLILGEPTRTDDDTLKPTRIRDDFELIFSTISPNQHTEKCLSKLSALLTSAMIDSGLEKPKLNDDELDVNQLLDQLMDVIQGFSDQAYTLTLPEASARDIIRSILQHWTTFARPSLSEPYDPIQVLLRKIEHVTDEDLSGQIKVIGEAVETALSSAHDFPLSIREPMNMINQIYHRSHPGNELGVQMVSIRHQDQLLQAIQDLQANEVISTLPDELKRPIQQVNLLDAEGYLTENKLVEFRRNAQLLYESFLATGNRSVLENSPSFKFIKAETNQQLRQVILSLPALIANTLLLGKININLDGDGQITGISENNNRLYLLNTQFLQELISDLIIGSTNLPSKINDISQLVNTVVESQIPDLSSRMDGLGTQVQEVSSRVESIPEDVGSQITSLSSRIDGLGTQVQEVSSRVESIPEDVGSQITSLSSQMGELGTRIQDVSYSVDRALPPLENQVSDLETHLQGLHDQVGQLSSELKELKRTAKDIQDYIDQQRRGGTESDRPTPPPSPPITGRPDPIGPIRPPISEPINPISPPIVGPIPQPPLPQPGPIVDPPGRDPNTDPPGSEQ